MQHTLGIGQPLDRGDLLAGQLAHRYTDGGRGLAIYQHQIGAAFTVLAAVFGAIQPQHIAQIPQQRHLRVARVAEILAIDLHIDARGPRDRGDSCPAGCGRGVVLRHRSFLLQYLSAHSRIATSH